MRRSWFVIAAVLAVLVTTGAVAQHKTRHKKTSHKSSAKTRKLREKLKQVENRRAEIRTTLRATEHKAAVVSSDLDAVDERLSAAAAKLDDTRETLTKNRARQRELSSELESAESQLALDTEAVRKRLRSSYMEGDAPAIGVLLGSASSGDIASRTYLLDRVASADRRALDNYRNQRDILARETQEAIAVVERIKKAEADQLAQEQDLEYARSAKAEVLDALQEKKGELQELLDQFENDENSIERQIAAAQASGEHGEVPTHFSGRMSKPVNGPVTSGFGMRFHPILHKTRLHAGIDFGAPTGTAIHAAASGVVVNAQYMRGFGNTVIIDHGGGIATVYGHCSRLLVAAGQHVTRGEHIANVGMTGLATGPHLHFEVHVRGHAVNPLGWL